MQERLLKGYKKYEKCWFKEFGRSMDKINKKGVTNQKFIKILKQVENICLKKSEITRKELNYGEEIFPDHFESARIKEGKRKKTFCTKSGITPLK